MAMQFGEIQKLLGPDAATLLEHRSSTIPAASLHLPGPDFVDRIFVPSDRQIPRATTDGEPIVVAAERSEPARAFHALADLYLQEQLVTEVTASNGNGSNGNGNGDGAGKRRRRRMKRARS